MREELFVFYPGGGRVALRPSSLFLCLSSPPSHLCSGLQPLLLHDPLSECASWRVFTSEVTGVCVCEHEEHTLVEMKVKMIFLFVMTKHSSPSQLNEGNTVCSSIDVLWVERGTQRSSVTPPPTKPPCLSFVNHLKA